MSGVETGTEQESGVISSDGKPYFGPARAKDYNEASWGMTLTSTAVVELMPDPSPPERARRRDNDSGLCPVFMKPMPDKDRLPGLIAILGNSRMARDTLMLPNHTLADYGSNRNWWSGESVELARVVHAGQEEPEDIFKDIIHETQRLMAFMAKSDRAYGSVEALSRKLDTKYLESHLEKDIGLETCVERFLWAWSKAAELSGETNGSQLFRTTLQQPSSGDEENDRPAWLLCLERYEEDSASQNFYDATNALFWGSWDEDDETQPCITQLPGVLVFRITAPSTAKYPGVGLKLLSSWYADRYLEENKAVAKAVRKNHDSFKQVLSDICTRKENLEFKTLAKDSKKVASKALFEEAIKALPREPVAPDVYIDEKIPRPVAQGYQHLADQLTALHKKVEQKLKGLFIAC